MKKYFKNLLTALCGANPYQSELDKVREEMELAGENVNMLHESYLTQLEKTAAAENKQSELEKMLGAYKNVIEKAEQQLMSYQKIVENYRRRLAEKDAMIEEIRKDYQRQVANYEKRIGDYNVIIASLRKEMAVASKGGNKKPGSGRKKAKTKQEPKEV